MRQPRPAPTTFIAILVIAMLAPNDAILIINKLFRFFIDKTHELLGQHEGAEPAKDLLPLLSDSSVNTVQNLGALLAIVWFTYVLLAGEISPLMRMIRRKKIREEVNKNVLSVSAANRRANQVGSAAIENWLKYENDLEILLQFPELIRVNGKINTRAQTALQTIYEVRESYDNGEMDDTELLSRTEAAAADIEESMSAARLLKDSAFSIKEKKIIRTVTKNLAHPEKLSESIVKASSLLAFPTATVENYVGSTALMGQIREQIKAPKMLALEAAP